MKILTWNVLHRVHAETHSEPAIRRWPDEAERVRAVVARVSEALSAGVEVVLLQEVSGDVLAELRAQLPHHAVLNHLYPRVPRQKGTSRSVADPTEHLVVVAPPGAKILRAQTFANDPGKGLLMVGVSEHLAVVSTHVSWGTKGESQLSHLAQVLRETSATVCIGGDFNTGREEISKAVGADVVISVPPAGSPRTRPQDDATGGSDIDHLLSSAALSDVAVLEHRDLSDHRPVAATVGAR